MSDADASKAHSGTRDVDASNAYSGTLMSKLLLITERRLQQLHKEGVVPKAARGKYPLVQTVQGYIRFLQRSSGGLTEGGDPDKFEPFKRRAYYQGELDKMKLAQERGELIPALEVEAKFASAFKLVSEFFDTLPDVMEKRGGMGAVQLAKMEEMLDDLREQLYRKLIEDSAEQTDAGRTVQKRG